MLPAPSVTSDPLVAGLGGADTGADISGPCGDDEDCYDGALLSGSQLSIAMSPNPRTDGDVNRPPVRSILGQRFFVGHLISVWGLALSNALHALALLAALWRVVAGGDRPRVARQWPRMAILLAPLGTYAILLLVSIAQSIDPATSARDLGEVVSLATLPLALLFIRGARSLRRVVDLVLVMVCVVAVYGVVQYHFTDLGMLQNRIPGPFSHYQTYAGVLMVGDLLLLGRLLAGTGWRQPINWIGLAMINWALMMTLTRGPWVGVAVTLAAFVLFRSRKIALGYLAVGLMALAVMPTSWSARVRSIGDLTDPSNYDRLCMLEAGLYMIEERPLFGLGPGMVRERYPIYRHPTAPRYVVAHLHNTFVQLAAERGLLSLAAYLWLMVASFVLAWRWYRRRGGAHGRDADLYLGTLLVLVGFNVAGLFEANWRDTEVQRLVLFVLAMPLCARGDQWRDGGLDSAPLSRLELGEALPDDKTHV